MDHHYHIKDKAKELKLLVSHCNIENCGREKADLNDALKKIENDQKQYKIFFRKASKASKTVKSVNSSPNFNYSETEVITPTKVQKMGQKDDSSSVKNCFYCNAEYDNLEKLESHRSTSQLCKAKRKHTKRMSLEFSENDSLNSLLNSGRKYPCYCGSNFDFIVNLKIHLLNNVDCGKSTFLCEICGEVFRDQNSLVCHVNIHVVCFNNTKLNETMTETFQNFLSCKICPARFKSEIHLKIHESLHSKDPGEGHLSEPENNTENQDCQSEISQTELHNQQDFIKPSKAPKQPEVFENTDVVFDKEVSFVKNFNMRQIAFQKEDKENKKITMIEPNAELYTEFANYFNNQEEFSTCKDQEMQIMTLELDEPVEYQPDEKLYKCKFCPAKFSRLSEAKEHEDSMHTNKENANQCTFCGVSFDCHNSLQEHTNRHLTEIASKNRFSCDFCPEKFEKLEDKEAHQSLHERNPKLQCKRCSEIFETVESYNRHVISGHGQTFYHYKCCHMLFNTFTELKIHQKDHQKDLLEHHNKIYHEKKVYSCEKCDREFKTKPDLLKHERMHREKYKCLECNLKFKALSILKFHQRTHLKV